MHTRFRLRTPSSILSTPLQPSLEQVVGSVPTAHARGGVAGRARRRGLRAPGGRAGIWAAAGARVAVTRVRRRLAVTGLAMERKGELRSGLRHEE